MVERPQLILLAGGNGAGKTTFYQHFIAPSGIPMVNADVIARELWPQAPEQHSYAAAKIAKAQRLKLLELHISFCFETVFSHPSKIDFIAQAKAAGYAISLYFIHVIDPMLNIARVKQRKREGGHGVPEDKITSRIPRAVSNIAKALPLVDKACFFDNSSADDPYVLVSQWNGMAWVNQSKPLPGWMLEIQSSM